METPPNSLPNAPAKTSGLAIASLITALTCVSPAAIICGHIALSQIKKSGGQLGGYGLALAGTIIGYVSLGISLLSLFSMVPMLFIGANAWKKGSDRASCIIMQRNIDSAILSYQISNNLKAGDPLKFQDVIAMPGNTTLSTTCPSGGTLEISPTIPNEGESAVKCPHAEELQHSSSITIDRAEH